MHIRGFLGIIALVSCKIIHHGYSLQLVQQHPQHMFILESQKKLWFLHQICTLPVLLNNAHYVLLNDGKRDGFGILEWNNLCWIGIQNFVTNIKQGVA